MSAVNVNDTYLEFLRTHHEDLSSLFCSELVAHAYQELGLIGKYFKLLNFNIIYYKLC